MEYFKLPFAGYRQDNDASIDGSYSRYRSSSPYGADFLGYVRYLNLSSSSVYASNSDYSRTLGLSVRCFKNSYVAPTNTYALIFDSQSGSEVATRYTTS